MTTRVIRVKIGRKVYLASNGFLQMVFVKGHRRTRLGRAVKPIPGYWKSLRHPMTYCEEMTQVVR